MLEHYPKLKKLWGKLTFKRVGSIEVVQPSKSAEKFKEELFKQITKQK